MDSGWWIVCGVLALVIFLNLGLIVSALRQRQTKPLPFIGKSISDLLNPWAEEDQALEDLHRRVEKLTIEKDNANNE